MISHRMIFLLSFVLMSALAHVGRAESANLEELAIYKVLFAGVKGPALLAKTDSAPKPSQRDEQEQAEYRASLKEKLPGVDDATITDYIRRQTAPALLNSHSQVGVKLLFVNEATVNAFWRKIDADDARKHLTLDDYRMHPEESPWARFQKHFSAQDYIQVSRVGFNREKTQALVYWFQWSDEEALSIWLVKQNGKWVIKGSVLEGAA